MPTAEKVERKLAIVVPEKRYARHVPRRSCLKLFSRPAVGLLDRWRNLFVWVSIGELEEVSPFVRQANQRHVLRGLFVEAERDCGLLPQLLHRAKVRTLKNMFIHFDAQVPRRVLHAYCIGAEAELIANAQVVDSELHVLSCDAQSYVLSFDEMPAIRTVGPGDRSLFEIAEDGSYLHWPAADVHLDIETIRAQTDAEYRERLLVERAEREGRIGRAIALLRREAGLRQGDVAGLSERQVRRIEKGEGTKVKTFRSLAEAHGMGLDEYLDKIAQKARYI